MRITHEYPVQAADWLSQWRPSAAMPSEHVEPLAALAFCCASLEHSALHQPPPAALLAVLQPFLRTVPSQFAFAVANAAGYEWLNLAALAEHLGEPALAWLIIDGVAGPLAQGMVTTGPTHLDEAQRLELLAICHNRRGRVARVAGHLDDARRWYTAARDLALTAAWRDALPQSEIGLANVAVARGNYPDVARRMTRLLQARPPIAHLYQVSALQLRAMARRKRGDGIGALLDSWTAFDLLPADDLRRAEVVVSMAETAFELHDIIAALRGFTSATDPSLPLRIRVQAEVGVLRTALVHLRTSSAEDSRSRLHDATEATTALLEQPLAPRDRVYALMHLAEASLTTADIVSAQHWLTTAATLAETFGYHDYTFQIAALAAMAASVATVPSATPPRRRLRQHPTLHRLRQLDYRVSHQLLCESDFEPGCEASNA